LILLAGWVACGISWGKDVKAQEQSEEHKSYPASWRSTHLTLHSMEYNASAHVTEFGTIVLSEIVGNRGERRIINNNNISFTDMSFRRAGPSTATFSTHRLSEQLAVLAAKFGRAGLPFPGASTVRGAGCQGLLTRN
jgi:hypothetical protein